MSGALAVATGGALGAVLRGVGVHRITARRSATSVLAILAINGVGSFVFGVLTSLATDGHLSQTLRLALGTGFCGGFTTFSTFALDTIRLDDRGRRPAAASLVVMTVTLSGTAGAIGLFVG